MRPCLPLPLLALTLFAVFPANAAVFGYEQVDLAQVTPAFSVIGDPQGSQLSTAMTAGDFDGDGLNDLVVSEPLGQGVNGVGTGIVTLIPHALLQGSLDLDATAVPREIHGAVIGDLIGQSLALGDFNGDSRRDLAIGAPNVQRDSQPRDTVFIIWSVDSLPQITDLANPGGVEVTELFAPELDIFGTPIRSLLGDSLAVADFDDDGTDDLIIGQPEHSLGQFGEEVGRVWVLYGASGLNASTSVNLLQFAEDEATIIDGETLPSFLGDSVATVDFDGDGIDDIVAGASAHLAGVPLQRAGRAHVIYGRRARPTTVLNAGEPADGTTTIEPDTSLAPEGWMGFSVGAGFWDDDAMEDVIIGAPGSQDDQNFRGVAYVVRGNATRPGDLFLSSLQGEEAASYLGNLASSEAGHSVALIDLDGDGRDDPVIGAPFDSADEVRPFQGIVWAPLSDGTADNQLVLTPGSPGIWEFYGASRGDLLGRSVVPGDINGDGLADLFIGTEIFGVSQGGALRGQVVALPSISSRARIVAATVVEKETADQRLATGDQIILTFDRAVDAEPVTIPPSGFDLSNPGATLGTDSTLMPSPFRPNAIVITLGTDFANILVRGSDPATSTAIDLNIFGGLTIVDALTFQPAVDRGVRGVFDDPVDLRWQLGAESRMIGPEGGLLLPAQNDDTDPTLYEFTKHSLFLPTNALAITETITIDALPGGFEELALAPGFRIRTDGDPTTPFAISPTLTVEYRDIDIDFISGQIEGLMRIFQLGPAGPIPLGMTSQSAFVPLGVGDTSQDPDQNTVSTDIDSLNPASVEGEAGLFVTLPANPVEERSIFVKPSAGAAAIIDLPVPTGVTTASIQPGDGSGYLLHTVEFPNFVETDGSDPARIEVKIRQATLFERVHPAPQVGANLFPQQSGALFIIETRDSSFNPVPFTDPVNIRVQYVERPEPTLTDTISFANAVQPANKMRIVRSRVDTNIGPDFQFIPQATANNLGTGVLTATGVANLTDADGRGAWGAVGNPAFVPPNQAPVIDPIGDASVDEGATLMVSVSATDPEGDAIVLAFPGLPAFATPTDNGDGTGSILFEPDFTDAGTHPITVTATDDGVPAEEGTENFTLTVNDVVTVSLQEIIDHLLQRTLLAGEKLDLADQNDDAAVDAADVVTFINSD